MSTRQEALACSTLDDKIGTSVFMLSAGSALQYIQTECSNFKKKSSSKIVDSSEFQRHSNRDRGVSDNSLAVTNSC